jgi:hypothetical protein
MVSLALLPLSVTRALWGAVEIARTSIRALLRVSESAELLPPALVTM